MKITIREAAMTHSAAEGYFGFVRFEVEGHKQPYELTLQSDKKIDDWNYALSFLNESGSEAEFEKVEQAIEEDENVFDDLVDAALAKLEESK